MTCTCEQTVSSVLPSSKEPEQRKLVNNSCPVNFEPEKYGLFCVICSRRTNLLRWRALVALRRAYLQRKSARHLGAVVFPSYRGWVRTCARLTLLTIQKRSERTRQIFVHEISECGYRYRRHVSTLIIVLKRGRRAQQILVHDISECGCRPGKHRIWPDRQELIDWTNKMMP